MMTKNFVLLLIGVLISCSFAVAQTAADTSGNEVSVALTDQAVAHEASGRLAISGKLRTTDLHGTPDSPVTSIRLVITNASPNLYTYISGWASFYDAEGVRCGSGLFKLNAVESGESAEVDTPGLRLVCSPSTWRILATTLLASVKDVTTPITASTTTTLSPSPTADSTATIPPLVLSIDGEDHPIQLGNPITIKTNNKPIKLILKLAK